MVMDGNAQWARARGLPSAAGHEAGRRSLEETVRLSRAWGIRALTAIAFSHENWSRPKVEVDFLMGLSERMIHDSVAEFLREEIRLRVIGDCSRLPVSLQKTAREAEAATKNNSQLDLTLAISYSGRRDIVQACGKLAQKVHSKLLRPEDIDESLFANELETSCENEFLYPDLLISLEGGRVAISESLPQRVPAWCGNKISGQCICAATHCTATSIFCIASSLCGFLFFIRLTRPAVSLRLSNFLLWQSAYSELFFTNTLWPDFAEADYLEALSSFESRDRRFGLRKL